MEAGHPLEGLEFHGVYNVYANLTNPEDVVSSIYSDVEALGNPPMGIDAPCGCLNPAQTSIAVDASNIPLLFPSFPQFEYDSFWTIGMETAFDEGQLPNTVNMGEPSDLCAGYGITNGSLFITGSTDNWPTNAVAGDDLKVLIARVTTCGDFSIAACAQIFVNGIQDDFQNECFGPLHVSHPYLDGACVNDSDGDGVCDEFEVSGCTDPVACNFDASVDEEDGSCTYLDAVGVCAGSCLADVDEDGVCDDIDECVGTYDACGVCNGPGPTFECGCTDILEGECDCDGNVVDNCGECGGENACFYCGEGTIWDSATQTCIVAIPSDSNFDGCVQLNDLLDLLGAFGNCGAEASLWQCGDVLDYQGYDYATTLIGEQCWFAENLRSENYENGDAIPSNLSDSEWEDITSGAVAVYGENASNVETYGLLYNWHAVDDARGLCPSGWHVPSDAEWTVMTDWLGGAAVAGAQMKSTSGWNNGGNGTNSSSFSGLPGGYRLNDGSFSGVGNGGYWWSSSPIGSNAWYRNLFNLVEFVFRDFRSPQDGFSVRCVKDAE